MPPLDLTPVLRSHELPTPEFDSDADAADLEQARALLQRASSQALGAGEETLHTDVAAAAAAAVTGHEADAAGGLSDSDLEDFAERRPERRRGPGGAGGSRRGGMGASGKGAAGSRGASGKRPGSKGGGAGESGVREEEEAPEEAFYVYAPSVPKDVRMCVFV